MDSPSQNHSLKNESRFLGHLQNGHEPCWLPSFSSGNDGGGDDTWKITNTNSACSTIDIKSIASPQSNSSTTVSAAATITTTTNTASDINKGKTSALGLGLRDHFSPAGFDDQSASSLCQRRQRICYVWQVPTASSSY